MRRNEEVNYSRQLAQAKITKDEAAIDALVALGPPPFATRDGVRVLREWADRLATGTGDDVRPRPTPLPADFSPDDRDWLMRGFHFSGNELYAQLSTVDLPALGLDFQVPMFFFEGTHDQQTPIELAEDYFSRITAPAKAFERFDGCHHFVVMNRPEVFLVALIKHVLPVVSRG